MVTLSCQSPGQICFSLEIDATSKPVRESRPDRDDPEAMVVSAHETDAIRGEEGRNLPLIELKLQWSRHDPHQEAIGQTAR